MKNLQQRCPGGLILCLLFAFAATLSAQMSVISYAGRLHDGDGNAVDSPGLQMKFLVYSDAVGGTLLYQDWHDGSDVDHPLVSVQGGIYGVRIGDDTTDHGGAAHTSLTEALAADSSAFLQVEVAGTPLAPREMLHSVPYALVSARTAAAYANRALGNLDAPVEIPVHLSPGQDQAIDLGSAARAFRDMHLKGLLADGTETRSLATVATVSGAQAWTNKTIDATLNTIVLDEGMVLIGNGGNSAQGRALSGDLALSGAGVATIQPDAVTNAKLANNAVDTAEFAGSAVTTAKIRDKAVTLAKFADGGPDQVLTTDAAGVAQWQNKTVFVSPSLPLDQLYAGNAANLAAAAPNLPPQALPTGGSWGIGSSLNVDGSTLAVDQANDRVGIGVAAPAAALHLKAGTATAGTSPLKFISGTDLAVAEDGAMEFAGGALKFTRDLWARRDFAFADAPPPILEPTRFSYFFDDFDDQVTTAMVWTANNLTGTQTVATVAPADNAMGVLQLNTGRVGTRSCLHKADAGIVLGVNAFHFEGRMRFTTNLSVANQEYGFAMGLHDDTALNAIDGVYFLYDRLNYGANWQCVTAGNATQTVSDSGIAVAQNAWYRLAFTVNAAGTAVDFHINGSRVATSATNIPVGAGRQTGPRILILKTSGNQQPRSAQVDYWLHKIVYATSR